MSSLALRSHDHGETRPSPNYHLSSCETDTVVPLTGNTFRSVMIVASSALRRLAITGRIPIVRPLVARLCTASMPKTPDETMPPSDGAAATSPPPPPDDAGFALAASTPADGGQSGGLALQDHEGENLPPLEFEPGVAGVAQKGVSAIVIAFGAVAFAGIAWGASVALFPGATSTQCVPDLDHLCASGHAAAANRCWLCVALAPLTLAPLTLARSLRFTHAEPSTRKPSKRCSRTLLSHTHWAHQ